jgi:hypothetical protein
VPSPFLRGSAASRRNDGRGWIALAAVLAFPVASAAELPLDGHAFNAQRLEVKCIAVSSANVASLGSCDVAASKQWFSTAEGTARFTYKRCIASIEAEYFVFARDSECAQVLAGWRDQMKHHAKDPRTAASIKADSKQRLRQEIEERPRVLQCQAKDGLWTNGGGIPRPNEQRFCMLPSPDAGKACQSSSDCRAATCLSSKQFPDGEEVGVQTTGVCSKYGAVGGCMARVEGGKAQKTVCVD